MKGDKRAKVEKRAEKNINSTHIRAKKIIENLKGTYPSQTALNHKNPFELLIATILSAQSTDLQVNKITEGLFSDLKTPEDYLTLTQEKLQDKIKGVGLYKNKSRFIIKTCRILISEYNGQVPRIKKELLKLPGVGRKTAGVVLSCAFNKDELPVDTHVHRVANRLGLVFSKKTAETENQLKEVIPKNYWSKIHHWFIYHGREICKARKPECSACMLHCLCLYEEDNSSS